MAMQQYLVFFLIFYLKQPCLHTVGVYKTIQATLFLLASIVDHIYLTFEHIAGKVSNVVALVKGRRVKLAAYIKW